VIWDTIFTAGEHTDSRGNKRIWTEADLDELVKSQDVPLVAFHPADQDKAATFGRVGGLRRVGGELQAVYTAVPEAIQSLVKDGLRLCKSVAIDPQTMRLRHIGLLGAGQEPAVAGLGYLHFSRAQGGEIIIKQEAIRMDDKERIKELEAEVAALKAEGKSAEFAKREAALSADVKREKAEKEAAAAEFAAYKDKVEGERLAARVKRLVDSGRILPAESDRIVALARALPDGEATVQFAKGNVSEKVSPREAYLRDYEARQEKHAGLYAEFANNGGGKAADAIDLSKINAFA